uniref:Uncharacterized protein n=1 Tax=Myoviridae sp. ctLjW1 TaxID=2825084 RepID=A0A8S5PPH9_9CAUD|nr:MAG TPA: hypothetical protein [Myoviridae sp. ctLjW1]
MNLTRVICKHNMIALYFTVDPGAVKEFLKR